MQANLKGITHPCPYCEKDGRTPTVEQFMKHRQQHNPMSNSTLTQRCPLCPNGGVGLTPSESKLHFRDHVSNSTQNDWEKRYDNLFGNEHHKICEGKKCACHTVVKDFIRKELADARKEEREKCKYYKKYLESLATLREEEV